MTPTSPRRSPTPTSPRAPSTFSRPPPERRAMADDATLPSDLSVGLRFCHMLAQDIRSDADDMAVTVLALVAELAETGLVEEPALEARRRAAAAVEDERQKPRQKV